jgi:hypothetical protein
MSSSAVIVILEKKFADSGMSHSVHAGMAALIFPFRDAS